MGRAGNSHDALLDAAADVVRERGAANLTLDAVSAKAGVSKGGLLYHFPTKEALLLGMLDRLRAAVMESHRAAESTLPESATRALRAHILSADFFQSERLRGLGAALAAAGSHDPKLLAVAREARETMIERLRTPALPEAFTTVVALALDGLWLLEVLGMSTPSPEDREVVMKELLRLVDVEEAGRRDQATGQSPEGRRPRRIKDRT